MEKPFGAGRVGGIAAGLVGIGIGRFSGMNFVFPTVAAFGIWSALGWTKFKDDRHMKAVVSIQGGHAAWFVIGALMTGVYNSATLSDPLFMVVLLFFIAAKHSRVASVLLIVTQAFALSVNFEAMSGTTAIESEKALLVHVIYRIVGIVVTASLLWKWRKDAVFSRQQGQEERGLNVGPPASSSPVSTSVSQQSKSEDPIASGKALSSEELLAAAVKQVRAAVQAEVKSNETAQWDQVAEDKAKLDRARKFVKETHIDRSLCRVYREVQHWPSWSKNNPTDFEARWNSLGVEDVSGEQIREKNHEVSTVCFRYQGHDYEVRMERDTGFIPDCDTNFAKIYLSCDGVRVLGIDASQKVGDDYDRWNPMDVIALRPGEWTGILVLWEERLGAKAAAQTTEWQTNNIASKASEIDL